LEITLLCNVQTAVGPKVHTNGYVSKFSLNWIFGGLKFAQRNWATSICILKCSS